MRQIDERLVSDFARRMLAVVGEDRSLGTRRKRLSDPAVREALLSIVDDARTHRGVLREAIDRCGISYRTVWALRPPLQLTSVETRQRELLVLSRIIAARGPISTVDIAADLGLDGAEVRTMTRRLEAAGKIRAVEKHGIWTRRQPGGAVSSTTWIAVAVEQPVAECG